MNYRGEIDGLRALAVLPVIFFHAGFSAFSGGFAGVDIFFVISGYLITTIIMNDLQSGTFSLFNFYERRARRILPALFFVMLTCIPISWIWLLPSDMEDFSKSLIGVSLFASNILFWHQSGYFDTAAELKPLLHTWSLSVEEQFYALFPLFLLLTWRLGRRSVPGLIAFLVLASLALTHWASAALPTAAFYLLPTRSWELLFGSLGAFYLSQTNRREFSAWLCELCGWLGLAFILDSIFTDEGSSSLLGVQALTPALGTLLIIIFANGKTLLGRILSHRLLVVIGLISYSAYLWHQPLFAFARHAKITTQGSFLFYTLPLVAFAMGYLSWRCVETPFRNQDAINRKPFFLLVTSCIVLFLIFGILGIATNGFDFRMTRVLNGDLGHIEFHRYIAQNYLDCEPEAIAKQALRFDGYLRCKQTKKGIPDDVLLGDSHAEHLFLGLAENRPNRNVAFYILDSSPFVTNPDFQIIFDEILGNRKNQNIILTMQFLTRMNGDQFRLYDGLSGTIGALRAAGKTVTLAGDVPRFPHDPGYCAYSLPYNAARSCTVSDEEAERQRQTYRGVLQRIAEEHNAPYVEIDITLCEPDTCTMKKDGSILYRDDNHLNILGSKLVGKYLATQLSP
ncbi:MAG: hypothetical protein RIQ81_310 [Pseudomonadota bacterium]|jgi:peptidoglycan/LPS O-acetylase OafA/YrhL